MEKKRVIWTHFPRVAGGPLAATAGLFLALAQGVGAQQPDLTGTWIFEVTVEGPPSHPIVVFEQDGSELGGHYSSEMLGESEFEGTVEGDEFTFSFQADVELLGPATVTYTGTIEDAETLTGTLDLGGLVQGSFTARLHENGDP